MSESETRQRRDTQQENLFEEQDVLTRRMDEGGPKEKKDVVEIRIMNEIRALSELKDIVYHYHSPKKTIYVKTSKGLLTLDLSTDFPFFAPQIQIDSWDEVEESLPQKVKVWKPESYSRESFFTLYNFSRLRVEDIIKEHWHPSIKIADIIERSVSFVEKNSTPISEVKSYLIHCSKKVSSVKIITVLFFVKLALALLISGMDQAYGEMNGEIYRQVELATFLNENKISKWYQPSKILEHPPVDCYIYVGIGKVLSLTSTNLTYSSLQSPDLSYIWKSQVFSVSLTLRFLSLLFEFLVTIPCILFTVHVLFKKNSFSFRKSIALLIILIPTTSFGFFGSIVDGKVAQNAYLAAFIACIALITHGYLEFGIALYALSLNLCVISLSALPILLLYITVFYLKEGFKKGMFTRKFKLQEVNLLMNQFSTVGMALIFTSLFLWLPILIEEDTFDDVGQALSQILLEEEKRQVSLDMVQGNLWFLLETPLKRGLVKTFLLLFCYFFIFVKMANPRGFNKKALLVLIHLLFLILCLFGNILGVHTECQALLLILSGLLYYECQYFFSFFSLCSGLEAIFKEQGRAPLCLLIVCVQLGYLLLSAGFLRATLLVAETTREKRMSQGQDDEGQKREERPINELFRVKDKDEGRTFNLQVQQYFLQNHTPLGRVLLLLYSRSILSALFYLLYFACACFILLANDPPLEAFLVRASLFLANLLMLLQSFNINFLFRKRGQAAGKKGESKGLQVSQEGIQDDLAFGLHQCKSHES